MIRAAAGAALIAFLVRRSGAGATLSLLARERAAYFAAAACLYLAGLSISAYRWKFLAAIVSIHAPFREFLSYYFIGAFTNLFVPGLVGGDAARAVYLGRKYDRLGPAAASVVADRGLGLLALFWFAALAAGSPMGASLRPSVTRPVVLIGLISFAGFLAAPLIARAERWMPHRLARVAGLVTPYLRRPASVIPAILLSALLQGLLVLGQFMLAIGLGLSIPFALFVLCVPIANVFASIPITLNGLGVREGTYAVLFGMAGVARPDAVALGLLWFASTTLGGVAGVVPFLTTETPAFGKSRAASA